MPDLFGTPEADRLVGTNGADVFYAVGNDLMVRDRLIGKNGDDTYAITSGTYNSFFIDDRGTDDGTDTILSPNGLYSTTSTGAISTFATAVKAGDTLVLNLPGENSWWRHSATPDIELRLVGQYAGTGIEKLVTSTGTYTIATGDTGTETADLIVGGNEANTFSALGGADFVFSNGGNDSIDLGAGDDFGFAGGGRDTIFAGAGDDRAYGGSGNDWIHGEAGNDVLLGEDGNDHIWGGSGADNLSGGDGRDWLRGGSGDDTLSGGLGNDLLFGQRGADTYHFDANIGTDQADIIDDRGDGNATWLSHDVIDLWGLNPNNATNAQLQLTAFDDLSFSKIGNDAVITIAGSGNTITVKDMLNASLHDKAFVEELQLGSSVFTFRFVDAQVTDVSNDRDWGSGYGSELNEIIYGTDGNDQIFGGTGINFIVTGDGADTLIYKVGDGQGLGGLGGGVSHDIIQDFDLTVDTLDFSELTGELGAGGFYLQYGEDAQGDATIFIDTGDYQTADVLIELRGISLVDLMASDALIF